MKSSEIERLRVSSKDFESGPRFSPGNIYAKFQIRCNGQANDILVVAKSVLVTVLENIDTLPPNNDSWGNILPKMFVSRCGPHPTTEELKKSMMRPIEERVAEQSTLRWSRQMFVNAFVPEFELRNWQWWHGVVISENEIQVVVSTDGDFFTWQSFRWLFIACGAVDVLVLGSDEEKGG